MEETEKYIWVVNLEAGGYGGESDITKSTERKLLGCEDDFYLWTQKRKKYFNNRKDAEDYVRPIAHKAFQTMIEDMRANAKDGDNDRIKEYLRRGLQEFRPEELDKKSENYELYHEEEPSTLFTCPYEHEYDRIGCYFAQVSRARLY